ncbi:Hypothetical predicted protein [Olea europaea subsp. europaea]|uniref:Uncharacterized protein n=1 Tax=Olea europaea subsp. europaea TaxID=158383 RepID=A0A8S0RM87_OLEEU|nr:Hypothetical predicted protein [Olea europaea subsp. europaea]
MREVKRKPGSGAESGKTRAMHMTGRAKLIVRKNLGFRYPILSPLSFNSSDRRLPIFSRCHHLPPANHREDLFTSSSSDLR